MPRKDQIPLRLDHAVMLKIKYIAFMHLRSVNGEVARLVLRYIAEYEARHGPIETGK